MDDYLAFSALFIELILCAAMYALGRRHGGADSQEAWRLGFKDGDTQGHAKGLNDARRGFFLNAQRTFGAAANDAPGYAWGAALHPAGVGVGPQRELAAAGVGGGGASGGRHHRPE